MVLFSYSFLCALAPALIQVGCCCCCFNSIYRFTEKTMNIMLHTHTHDRAMYSMCKNKDNWFNLIPAHTLTLICTHDHLYGLTQKEEKIKILCRRHWNGSQYARSHYWHPINLKTTSTSIYSLFLYVYLRFNFFVLCFQSFDSWK